MTTGWRLALIEREGEFTELHSLRSAEQAVARGWLTGETPAIVYDDQNVPVRKLARDFDQFATLLPDIIQARADADLLQARMVLLRQVRSWAERSVVLTTQGLPSPVRTVVAMPATNPQIIPPSPVERDVVRRPDMQAPSVASPARRGSHWVGLAFWGLMGLIVVSSVLSRCTVDSGGPESEGEAASFSFEALPAATTYRLVAGTNNVNVRSGPGLSYDVLETISAADDIIAVARSRDDAGDPWFGIRTRAGGVGYVKARLLALKPEAAALEAPRPEHPVETPLDRVDPLPAQRTYPTSFNCNKARGAVERNICTNATLASGDVTMSNSYNALLRSLSGAERTALVNSQKDWRVSRDRCADRSDVVSCLAQSYNRRISDLENMRSGRTASAAPVPAPVAPLSTPSGPRYVAGEWTYPGSDQMADLYPSRALDDEVEGTVTIDCAINAAGRVTSCDIISESPKGYGFGPATVKAFIRGARVKPASVGGMLRDGDRKKFTYRWTL